MTPHPGHRGWPVMGPRGAVLASFMALASSVAAAPSTVAGDDKVVETFRRADFKIFATQADLPVEVKTALSSYVKGEALADPGRKWDPGSGPTSSADPTPPVPRRRLVLAGAAPNLAFVAYEHGGGGGGGGSSGGGGSGGGRGGKHHHVVLMTRRDGQASVAYACAGPPIVPPNLDGFRAAVRRKICVPEAGAQEPS